MSLSDMAGGFFAIKLPAKDIAERQSKATVLQTHIYSDENSSICKAAARLLPLRHPGLYDHIWRVHRRYCGL